MLRVCGCFKANFPWFAHQVESKHAISSQLKADNQTIPLQLSVIASLTFSAKGYFKCVFDLRQVIRLAALAIKPISVPRINCLFCKVRARSDIFAKPTTTTSVFSLTVRSGGRNDKRACVIFYKKKISTQPRPIHRAKIDVRSFF